MPKIYTNYELPLNSYFGESFLFEDINFVKINNFENNVNKFPFFVPYN